MGLLICDGIIYLNLKFRTILKKVFVSDKDGYMEDDEIDFEEGSDIQILIVMKTNILMVMIDEALMRTVFHISMKIFVLPFMIRLKFKLFLYLNHWFFTYLKMQIIVFYENNLINASFF